ncbi:hypothetical protein ACKKBG_A28280 [Auxenochlorella protothecoides x Auxenochlorella symbiontica]|uniref:EF-hand domain-containing protein n=2 Tax=Auxenochlorella protothecoides TaxID=3075 RepID=A0A1D1ZU75_AUXPR
MSKTTALLDGAEVQPEEATHPDDGTSEEEKTTLQRHIEFWDPKGTGVIWPRDVYAGFRRLGFSRAFSTAITPIISGGLSFNTQTSKIPDPRLPVYVERIHLGIHTSDTGSYDAKGHFDSKRFDEVFAQYDIGNKGGLTQEEVKALTRGQREPKDPKGWTGSWIEWNISFHLAARESPDGKLLLYKEDLLGIMDGTLFPKISKEVAEGTWVRHGHLSPGLRRP